MYLMALGWSALEHRWGGALGALPGWAKVH